MCKNLDNNSIGELDTNAALTAGGVVVLGGLSYLAAEMLTEKVPFLTDNPLISGAVKVCGVLGTVLFFPQSLSSPNVLGVLGGVTGSGTKDLKAAYEAQTHGLYDGWDRFDRNGQETDDVTHEEITVHA